MKRIVGVAAVLVLVATAAGAVDLGVTGLGWQALPKAEQAEFVRTALADMKARWKARSDSDHPMTHTLAKAYNKCFATETFDAAWVEEARVSITHYYERPRTSCHQAFGLVDGAIQDTCNAQLVVAAQEGGFIPISPAPAPCSPP